MKVIPDVVAPQSVPKFGHRLTEVEVVAGLPPIEELQEELETYIDVLLGRADASMDSPYLDLMEVAAAYYARAKEIEILIYAQEQARTVVRGSPYYKFRTGQLRAFTDLAKVMADLGSRRLTQERLLYEQRYDAGNGDS